MKVIAKLWGSEKEIVNNTLYCMKELTLRQNYQCSLHYHRVKTETFYVLSGKFELEVGKIRRLMKPGDSQTILPMVPHRFIGLAESSVFMEASTHHYEEDVVRIESSKFLG